MDAPAQVLASLQAQLGAELRAVLLFGSYLTPALQRPDSVPDIFALVEHLPRALRRLGVGPLRRCLARPLPPAVIPYRDAKLNLATPAQLERALAQLPDLYACARLGKRARLLYARDPACAAQVEALRLHARRALVQLTLAELAPDLPPARLCQHALRLSYRAELRPEPEARITRAYACAAAEHHALYDPLFEEARGLPPRFADRRAVRRLLWRSRARFALRMLRQVLLYRGWLGYALGKLRRSRAAT